jgi:nucleotide-binding universal stress UspA family protein
MWEIEKARDDFRRAHAQARWEQVRELLGGQSSELLSYEQVRDQLRATASTDRGLQDIPLDAVVGSVGRTKDFTRSFLPRRPGDQHRWVRVEAAMLSAEGLPPIDVYKIGEAYFVLDGNHRVSVARQLGFEHIQAYVREFHTDVPLTPDVKPDELIAKSEHAAFLDRTGLARLRPEADLSVSVPGQHPVLEEHISVHRYFMGIDQERPIPYEEAVAHWYDEVYLPVVRVIRDQDLLKEFPHRTEADLYLWLAEHRFALEQELRWEVRPEVAARDLALQSGRERTGLLSRLSERVVEPLLGRPPGEWRREQLALRESSLFTDVLVTVTGRDGGWAALDRAIEVLQHEEGRLLGIHVVSSEAEREGEAIAGLEAEFSRRCRAAGIEGTFAVQVGEVARTICRRARWTSLAVVGLAHPPGDRPVDRLSSGLRWLIQHCPGPVLAVPESGTPAAAAPLASALLAYDGSPKATEALYLAAYLAGKWPMKLAVLYVDESGRPGPPRASSQDGGGRPRAAQDGSPLRPVGGRQALARARAYLEGQGVEALFLTRHGQVAPSIMEAAAESSSALIILGGYGFSPPLQIVLGSAVDQVLRECELPVLISR